MKKLIFLILMILGLINSSHGQDNIYGLSFGVNNGFIVEPAIEGGASFELNTGYSVGLEYSRRLKDNLYLQTGLNLYSNSVSVTPSFYPDIDMTPQTYDIRLLYIPIFLKIDLSKYFFVNGGLIIDIDNTRNNYIANQSGVGSGIGIGTNILNREKFAIQLNPYVNFHGILRSNQDNYPERVLDTGIKLKVMIK